MKKQDMKALEMKLLAKLGDGGALQQDAAIDDDMVNRVTAALAKTGEPNESEPISFSDATPQDALGHARNMHAWAVYLLVSEVYNPSFDVFDPPQEDDAWSDYEQVRSAFNLTGLSSTSGAVTGAQRVSVFLIRMAIAHRSADEEMLLNAFVGLLASLPGAGTHFIVEQIAASGLSESQIAEEQATRQEELKLRKENPGHYRKRPRNIGVWEGRMMELGERMVAVSMWTRGAPPEGFRNVIIDFYYYSIRVLAHNDHAYYRALSALHLST